MKMTCPSCGCSGDEELFGADMEWRKALMHALKLPSNCGPVAGKYVKLFAPLKRNLSSARACKLLKEVSELILAEETAFDRSCHRIPAHVWATSLQIMLDKPDLQRPITNHNYLIKVAIGQMTKRADIEQSDRVSNRRNHTPSQDRKGSMQKADFNIGGGSSDPVPTPLESLPVGEQKRWMVDAEKTLKATGIKAAFITKLAIEAEANAMILEART